MLADFVVFQVNAFREQAGDRCDAKCCGKGSGYGCCEWLMEEGEDVGCNKGNDDKCQESVSGMSNQ